MAQHDALFYAILTILRHATAVAHELTGLQQHQATIGIFGHQQHALALDTLNFARCQVEQHLYLLANKGFRNEMFSNAAYDGPLLQAQIDGEFEQFFGFGYFFGGRNKYRCANPSARNRRRKYRLWPGLPGY